MTSDGGAALDGLYWRAEILQAMYWMRGEGLADDVTPPALAQFLVADPGVVLRQCAELVSEGFLEVWDGPRYRLTELGTTEGGRSFQDEFADYIHPAHAECGADCWCKDPKHAGEPCPSTPTRSPATPSPSRPEKPRD